MSDARTDGILCCRYKDAGTDAPELPPRRVCTTCSLMIPAKRYSRHILEKHASDVFRCDECHSFLDKDDFLIHVNKHSFDLLPEHLKEEYYKNEKAILEEEARIDAIDELECQKLLEYFRKQDEAKERERQRMAKEKEEKNVARSQDPQDKADAASDDSASEHVAPAMKKTAKDEPDAAKRKAVTEPESDAERSSPKRKKVELKRSKDGETPPANRQRRSRRASVARGGRRVKEFDDRDDGNDGDDEVNTPEASPSTAAVEPREESSDRSPKASRTCPICGKQYRASSSYFYHMKYFHKRSREHECSVCNKKFGTKANLAQHASIHSGAYDLECKECGKRFKSKPSLYIHEQSHGGPKRWACAQCGRSFRWRTHLARHVTRHAAERAHVCSTCGRGFSVRCDLLRHARTHAADEFHCATCGLKFAQKRYLQVHMVKKHPETPSQVVTRS